MDKKRHNEFFVGIRDALITGIADLKGKSMAKAKTKKKVSKKTVTKKKKKGGSSPLPDIQMPVRIRKFKYALNQRVVIDEATIGATVIMQGWDSTGEVYAIQYYNLDNVQQLIWEKVTNLRPEMGI